MTDSQQYTIVVGDWADEQGQGRGSETEEAQMTTGSPMSVCVCGHKGLFDFPTAWAIQKAMLVSDHDPRCSAPRTDYGMLCDCDGLVSAWCGTGHPATAAEVEGYLMTGRASGTPNPASAE